MAPFPLVFATTESRLPIPVTVIDDQILELNELFQLQISVGQSDPPTGHGLGDIQSALVRILDNEGMLYSITTLATYVPLIGLIEVITQSQVS